MVALISFIRISGLIRIALLLQPEIRIDSFSKADMDLLDTMYLRNISNSNVIDEFHRSLDNLGAVKQMIAIIRHSALFGVQKLNGQSSEAGA